MISGLSCTGSSLFVKNATKKGQKARKAGVNACLVDINLISLFQGWSKYYCQNRTMVGTDGSSGASLSRASDV